MKYITWKYSIKKGDEFFNNMFSFLKPYKKVILVYPTTPEYVYDKNIKGFIKVWWNNSYLKKVN